jgi:hypothetical protein
MISEFMALNKNGLLDGDDLHSDWLEIHNSGTAAVDLTDWELKDGADTWTFPSISLGPGEFRVIFASNGREDVVDPVDPYMDPAGNLHTNFKLRGSGEYLGLYDNLGAVVHEYDEYPQQFDDISYGIAQNVETTEFVVSGDTARYIIPDGDPGNWTENGFVDSDWDTGDTGIGFSDLVAGFAVKNFKANVSVGNLATALQVIDNPGMQSYINTANVPIVNFLNSGGAGHYTAGQTNYPGFTGDMDQFVIEALAMITIPAAGQWAFGVNSDDGFSLELDNGADNFYMEFTGGRGAGDTISTFNITTAGIYNLRLVQFEGGGGSSCELFAAQGAHGGFNAGAFDLVGDTANGGLAVYSEPVDGGGGGGGAFSDLIETNVEDVMKDVNSSAYVRIPFTVSDPSQVESLTLKMKYDDGYVAYLNGVEIARRNAPATPLWSSNATGERTDAQAAAWENVNASGYINELVTGENVLAIHGLNFATDDGDFLLLPELVEVTYLGLGEHFFATDTPGEANTEEFWLYVENVDFSHERGFHDDPFDLTLTTDTAGAEIYYTTDGSAPNDTDGVLYVAPISVTTTTAVRATAYKSGHASADSVTHTYIFLEDVLQQPDYPAGFPATWKGVASNYGVNPNIVNHPEYGLTIRDDMRAVPTVSIVTSVEDMFGDTGIYSNPGGRGQAWERPASVEWFNTDGSTLFQVNAGVRIVGGASRGTGTKKHSFRLAFKSMYGPATLNYPVFEDTDLEEFNTITFRAGFNDTFWGGTMLQDRWAHERQIAAGGLAGHGRFVHLYIDGLYWGLYNPLERTDDAFAASYLGGDKEDYDYYTNQGISEGNSTAWNLLHSLANDAVANYAAIEEMLDIPAFCDYLMINQFAYNGDWPHNNWRATYNREGGGKWRFHMWDAEFGLRSLNGNNVNSFGGPPGSLFQKMLASPEFIQVFADRAHRLLFNDGVLTPQANIDWVNGAAAGIYEAVVGESARWSGNRSNWESRINNLRTNYFPQRTGIYLDQIKAVGRYPDVDAPSFDINGLHQHGGIIEVGDSLTINAPGGTIYYMLDGSDPRQVGGGISPGALVYSGAITLDGGAFVKSRAYDSGSGTWSALNEAIYYVDLAPDIRITEMMYNPADPTAAEIDAGYANNDDFEYIEIQNISEDETLPLEGLRFNNGIDFTFGDVSIAPGHFAVIVSNQAAFTYRYSGFSGTIAGEYGSGIVGGTSLNNGGEKIQLDSPNGGIIHDFNYGDGWYGHTDGEGFSLTIRDPRGADELWDQKIGWRPSTAPGGSPGYEDALTDPGTIVVNEVLAHSDAPFVDTIELYNTSTSAVDISGWFLSDSSADLTSYQIPVMPPILSGQYAVFYADEDFGGSFLLSEHGEDVYLSSNAGGVAGGYREHVDFGASPNNVSIGLHVKSTAGTDFTLLGAHTFGSANADPYFEDLVINELLYHPLDPTEAEMTAGYTNSGYFEFIEIYNSSDVTTYTLSDFYLSSGVGFTFGWYDADDGNRESWTLEPGATASWDAVLPAGLGSYEVFARWDLLDGLGGERSLDGRAVYSITHDGGTTAVIRDQKPELDDEGPDYIDEFGWVSLGTYDFDSTAQVVLTRGTSDPNNWTIADNIKFVRSGFSDVVVDDPTLGSWHTANGPSTIGPGEYLVVVGNYAAFDSRYDISANSIPVAGEYTGTLSNNGEKVKLLRATAPDAATDFIPYYRIDYVNYNDKLPWPVEPDGGGYSLIRLRSGLDELYGNDPVNWLAGSYRGTPGLVNELIDTTPPTAPGGVTGEVGLAGGTQIELTWTAAADPDSGVDHYIIYRDGMVIGTSSSTSYNDTAVSPVTQYSYQVSAVNRDQFAGPLSLAANITIPGPAFIELPGQTTVRLVFTEPLVEASAEDTGNYTFSGGVVSQATLIGADAVELTVPAFATGQPYTVTVDGIETISGLLMPDAQQIGFEYYRPQGNILREYWTGIGGSVVSNLTSNAAYPDNPTRRNYPGVFEAPLNQADNYGTRMRGYIHPAVSGMYTFSIASDDSSELYLSTDTDPANMTQIAYVSGSTGWRNWTVRQSQQSEQIFLSAGLTYYIEAIQKEGSGGDHLSVAWKLDAGAWEGPIPGAYLSPYIIDTLDHTGPTEPGNFAAQSLDSARINVSWDASVDAESGVAYYVVYRDGLEVGTTATTSYIDTGLDQTQSYMYSVAAVNTDNFEGYSVSTASLSPRPSVTDAAAVSTTEILVTFGKEVTEATAELVGNYVVTDGAGAPLTVLLADWDSENTDQVTLSLAGSLAENVIYTLTVQQVEDGNGLSVEPNAAVQFVYGSLDANLLAWWTFDVDNEIIAHDLTSNDRDLAVLGAEWEAGGRIGGAYRFDGGAGDYLVNEDPESFINGLGAFTFAAWIKADSIGTDRGFYYLRDPDGRDEYGFRHDGALQNQGNQPNGFRGGIRTTGGTQRWESTGSMQTIEWQHIAITWEAGQNIQVYIDSFPISSGWMDAPQFGTIRSSSRMIVGRGSQDGGGSWQGLIDDVRIYSAALTQAQVTALIDPRPVAQDDSYQANEDGVLTVVGSGVLANDFDPDPGPAVLAVELTNDVDHGVLNLNPDGSFDYTPTPGYTGADSFTYRAYDSSEYSDPANVSIAVLDAVRVVSVEVIDNTHVDLLFSTYLEATSAQAIGNYLVDGGLEVTSATLSPNARVVSLVLAPAMEDNQPYTLTISNIQDLDGPPHTITPGTEVAFTHVTWFGLDIGPVSAAGAAGESGGLWTVEGSGADIWANSDEFHYVSQPYSGDFTVTARVASIENTNGWAKAGIMIRETLDAYSTNAFVCVTPSSGMLFQRRNVTGQQSRYLQNGGLFAPQWVRLVRESDLFTAYRSFDGVNWTLIGADTIVMAGQEIHVGMAVTSHNDGVLATAEFDNVSIIAADYEAPTVDIADVDPDPRDQPVDAVDIVFSEEITGLDISDLTFTLDGGPNLLSGAESLGTIDNITWTLGGLTELTSASGTFELTVHAAGSGIQDGAGNLLATDASDNWLTVLVGPIPNIVNVSPDPRNSAVSTVRIVFSEPITGLDTGDLNLVRDGGANLLDGGQTLDTSDNITWTLDGLADLTAAEGTYTLTLVAVGSGIQNAVLEDLPIDASDTWVTDTHAPTATITAVDPDPRGLAVAEIEIIFEEPITGLDVSDLILSRDGGEDLLTGDESLTTSDNVTWTLGDLLDVTGTPGSGGGFVAFNDQAIGGATHANTTTYAGNGTTSGELRDINTGLGTGVTLTVSQNGVNYQSGAAAPWVGTDAYDIFNGYVDFRAVGGASLEIQADQNDSHTHTFSGLDAGNAITYNFHGTAIRGNSGYANRWTIVTLIGAEAFTVDHSGGIGVVTAGLSANQVAIWVGHNSAAGQGFVAGWTDIDPGPDGAFSILSTQYTGPTPGVGTGTANGTKGYAIAGLRLEETAPNGTEGAYALQLAADGSGIQDAAGNAIAVDAVETWIIDTSPPTADIVDVSPDPRGVSIDQIEIVFSEAVTGLDIEDMSLVRNGGDNLLTGAESLTSTDGVTWALGDLQALTADGGNYTLTLKSTGSEIKNVLDYLLDGDASDTWVTNTSVAPSVADPIGDVSVNEDSGDSVLDLSATFEDPDLADSLTLSVSGNTNVGLVTTNLVGTDLTLSCVADQNGTADITVRATDQSGLWIEDVFTVTVNPTDDPPVVANPISSVAADEDDPDTIIDISNVFDDPDFPGDTLVFSVTGNTNTGMVTTNIVDGELTLSYVSDQYGTAEVTVRATDQNGAGVSVEDTFTVTVAPVGDDPTVANPIADKFVDEDAPDTIIDLSSVFDDRDLPADTLTFSIMDNTNPLLVSASVNGSMLTLSYFSNQHGASDITVRAIDQGGVGVRIEDMFTVTVNSINDTPTLFHPIGDVVVNENDSDTVLGMSGVFKDVEDGLGLSLLVLDNTNPGLVTAELVGTQLTLSYLPNQSGTAEITVRATDSGTPGLSIDDTFTVTVNPDNFAPTVTNPIADVTVNSGSSDTVMHLSDVFADNAGVVPTLDYTAVEIDPVTGDPSAGTGLFQYKFTVYGHDGADASFATTSLTFTGPIQQLLAFGSANADDEFFANTFEGIEGSGYIAALDTWIYQGWQLIAPSDTSLSGTTVVVSAGSGTSTLYQSKDILRVVATGAVQWDGLFARRGKTYETSGTADGNRLVLSVEDNTNTDLVTANMLGSRLTLAYTPGAVGDADITVRATDPEGAWIEETFTVTVEPSAAEVVDRHIFYNNSALDSGGDDDAAIDPAKTPLLQGVATSANQTSYPGGINGLMIDISGLTGTPTVSDFGVRVNQAANPDTWSTGPAPQNVTVRPGEGSGGSDRVTLTWADGAILNQWVEVTVLAGANTGLGTDDVFYVGNTVGDTNDDGTVDADDLATLFGEFGLRGGTELVSDVNIDGRVNLTDFATLRSNFGTSVGIPTLPATAPPAAAPAAASEPNVDILAESVTSGDGDAIIAGDIPHGLPPSVEVAPIDLPAPEPVIAPAATDDLLLGEGGLTSGESLDAALDTDDLLVDMLAESALNGIL